MNKKEDLDLWTYPEWIKYLRAIIRRVTPIPRQTVQRVLDTVAPLLEGQPPVTMAHLMITPPSRAGAAQIACQLANGICLIATYWAGYDGKNTWIPLRSSDVCWGKAHAAAKDAERWAVPFWQQGSLDLIECAIEAMSKAATDLRRKDAAYAAATAGHFKLAHDILSKHIGDPV